MRIMYAIILLTAAVMPSCENTRVHGSELAKSVSTNPDLLLLAFTTGEGVNWCGLCNQMKPVVQGMIDDGYAVCPIDIQKDLKEVEAYNVTSVPTFILVRMSDHKGTYIKRHSGSLSRKQLEGFFLVAGDSPAQQSMSAHTYPSYRRGLFWRRRK